MFSQYKGNEFLTNTETPTPFFTPIKSFYPILPSPQLHQTQQIKHESRHHPRNKLATSKTLVSGKKRK